jgi:hypothetical protein
MKPFPLQLAAPILCILLSLNASLSNAQLSGTYTIGKGGDYETFSDAAEALNKTGIIGTVTFNVLTGTYTEQFTLGSISGAIKMSTVVFQSQSGSAEDVILEYEATEIENNYIVRLDDCQHVEFKDLTFHATGLGRAIVLLGNSGNIGISGCSLSGLFQANSRTTAALIFSDGQSPENLAITGNRFSDCSFGIYVAGTLTGIPGVNITDNTFSNTGYTSIYLSRVLGPAIIGNTISAGYYGIHITSGGEGLEVTKNRVATTIEGIKINFGGNEVQGLVANNCISVVGVSDGAGLDIQSSSDLSIFHNSVLMNSINSSCKAFDCNSSTAGKIHVLNNSFSCMNEGYASYVQDPATLGQCDYNNYYSASNMMFYRGEKVYDLADLKKLGSHDQHSVSVYPNHTSETDLHIYSGWLAGKGVAILDVSDDIDGDPRDPNHPDIGADEFSDGTVFLPPFSGNISVGSGETYETLQSLFDVLKVRGISAHLFIRLTSGFHDEQAELVTIPGSGPDRRVTITRPMILPVTDSVVLRYDASAADDNFILRLHGADFVTISGLIFHAENDTYRNIIDLHGGADSVKIANNTFRSESLASNDDRKIAIVSDNGHYFSREITGNTFTGGAYGIKMRRASQYVDYPRGAVIEDNTMSRVGYIGIYLQNHHAPHMLSNRIGAGMYGMLMTQCTGSYRIEKNTLDIGSQYGIYLSGTEAYPLSRGTIANNFIHVGGTGKAYGMFVSGTDYLNVTYNSIHITSTHASDGRAFYCSGGSQISLKNNIFANTGGGYAYYVTTTSAISGSDYNDIYTTGPNLAMFNDLKTTIEELKEGNSYHDHCISVDPGFTSDADLHASNEALKGAAIPIVSVSDDIDGDLRHLATPDIGADEFSGGGNVMLSELPLGLPGIFRGNAEWLDYDFDKDLDILISGNGLTTIYENYGSGVFNEASVSLMWVDHANVALGDHDNNNLVDIFLTGEALSGEKGILYINEQGSFTAQGSPFEDMIDADAEWADFDNNGTQDILVTGITETGVPVTCIYWNSGADFTREDILLGMEEADLAVEDYDLDGDMDFMICGKLQGVPTTRIYENRNGEFFYSDYNLTGVYNGTIAWGDYDSDGSPEVLVCGDDDSNDYFMQIYTFNEDHFEATGPPRSGFISADAQWTDYDNDGDADLIICGQSAYGRATTLFQNNAGVLTEVDARLPGVIYGSVAWGDFDADGDPDLLVTGLSGEGPVTKLFVNNCEEPGDPPAPPSGLQVMPGDSYAMLRWEPGEAAGSTTGSLTYNVMIGTSSIEQDVLSSCAHPDGLRQVMDYGNVRGNTAFTIRELVPGTTYHWKVQSIDQGYRASAFVDGGSFSTLSEIFSNEQEIIDGYYDGDIDAGDFDNDGDMDFAVCGWWGWQGGRSIHIYRNDNGIFSRFETDLPGVDDADLEWGDYDNDGDLDLLVTGCQDKERDIYFFYSEDDFSAATFILRNNNGLSFTNISHNLPNIRMGVSTWGDCDNDGDLDVLLSGCLSTSDGSEPSFTDIFINDGAGNFNPLNAPMGQYRYADADWGDYDLDGDLDLLISGDIQSGFTEANYATHIYTNLGNNHFELLDIDLPGLKDGAVAWADFSGDRRPDIILTGRPADRTYLFRNVGNGMFIDIMANIPAISYSSVDPGDYDNDGDLDLLLMGTNNVGSTYSTYLYRNEGLDQFTPVDIAFPNIGRGAARFADWSGNGTLDIILSGSYSLPLYTYRNNLPNVNTPPTTPENLSISMENNKLRFLWGHSTDEESPFKALTYNLRIGQTPGGVEIKSPESASDGYRRVVRKGNVEHRYSWDLEFEGFGLTSHSSDLYWSVQAVDQGYMGSPFAPEDTLDLSGRISTVEDVPFDQGGKVTLKWQASDLDHNNSFLTKYSIWRSIASDKKSMAAIKTTKANGETIYWEWVANQPAHKLPVYAYTCATVNDSMAGYDGMHQFMVSAHTSNPDVYFDSEPVSGYSVDNLAPLAPMNLSAQLVDDAVVLNWTANAEADLAGYAVFRDTEAGIDPATSEPLAVVTGAGYTDSDLQGGASAYSYVVCAADIHGNLSEPGNEVSVILTGIEDEIIATATAFRLYPVAMDPSGKHARITFDLAETTHVNLRVIAADGRVTEILVNDELRVGRHMIKWIPTVAMPAGVYLVEMCTEEYRGIERIVVAGD